MDRVYLDLGAIVNWTCRIVLIEGYGLDLILCLVNVVKEFEVKKGLNALRSEKGCEG